MDSCHDLEQYMNQFGTEEACEQYFFQTKWPNGFECPYCRHGQCYKISSLNRITLFECKRCHHQTSLKVGTVMEGSRTSFRKWLIALFLASRTSPGINASQLSTQINVTYKTAWLMLHKIRHAMNQSDSSILLCGFVQVNDACYGNPYRNMSSHRYEKEHPILIGASMDEQGLFHNVKIRLVPIKYLSNLSVTKKGQEAFKNELIQPNVEKINFQLGFYKSRRYKKLYPFFHAANQWIKDTFHGLGTRHLNVYFGEFCFRLNRLLEKSDIRGNLIQLCMKRSAITYRDLTRCG